MKGARKGLPLPQAVNDNRFDLGNVIPIRPPAEPHQPQALATYHLLSTVILQAAMRSKSKAVRRLYSDAMDALRTLKDSDDAEVSLTAEAAMWLTYSYKGRV